MPNTGSITPPWEKVRRDPEGFIRNVLGVHLWEKQMDIIRALTVHRRVSVRSCHGAGKSFCAASTLLWFLFAHPRSLALVTSPSFRQVEHVLFKEIRIAHKRAKVPLGGKMLSTRYEIDTDWYAMGLSTATPENFAGFHAENILVVADESSGIDDPIFEAMQGTLSSGNAKLLLIGNPTRSSGYFHQSFSDPDFCKIHISAFDIPNVKEKRLVIPGLSTFEWTEMMARKYGRDSDPYRIRVLGEPPKESADTFISVTEVEGAIDAERPAVGTELVLGVDVARYGDDSTDMVERKGNRARVHDVAFSQSITETAGKVVAWLIENKRGIAKIDTIGVGAGVYDIIREDGRVADRVLAVNVARAPEEDEDSDLPTKERYAQQRDQGWAIAKEFLTYGILEKHENWYELAQPKHKTDSRGRLKIESKDEMKKRKVASPNTADALIVSLLPGETEGGGGAWTG